MQVQIAETMISTETATGVQPKRMKLLTFQSIDGLMTQVLIEPDVWKQLKRDDDAAESGLTLPPTNGLITPDQI
jgi:hypothetical protein